MAARSNLEALMYGKRHALEDRETDKVIPDLLDGFGNVRCKEALDVLQERDLLCKVEHKQSASAQISACTAYKPA